MGKFGQFPVVVVSIRSCSLICSLYLGLSIEIARGVGMPPFLKDAWGSCQPTKICTSLCHRTYNSWHKHAKSKPLPLEEGVIFESIEKNHASASNVSSDCDVTTIFVQNRKDQAMLSGSQTETAER